MHAEENYYFQRFRKLVLIDSDFKNFFLVISLLRSLATLNSQYDHLNVPFIALYEAS